MFNEQPQVTQLPGNLALRPGQFPPSQWLRGRRPTRAHRECCEPTVPPAVWGEAGSAAHMPAVTTCELCGYEVFFPL